MVESIGFKASSNPDTMYCHQATWAPDNEEFIVAIVKEINYHITNNHWQLVPKSEVPPGTKVRFSIGDEEKTGHTHTWSLASTSTTVNKRTELITQKHTLPVVDWSSIRLISILSIFNRWYTKQVDFCASLPVGTSTLWQIETLHGDGDTHVLKFLKNIYGSKNSGWIWNEYLV